MVANFRQLPSPLVITGGFVGCQNFLHPFVIHIGYFALSMLDLPLSHLLFLVQIIAEFLMSLFRSVLCDLFGLYNSDSLCFFRTFVCFLFLVEVSNKFLDTIHCQKRCRRNRDYTLGTDFRQEVIDFLKKSVQPYPICRI